MPRFMIAFSLTVFAANPAHADSLATTWMISKFGGLGFGILLILFMALRTRGSASTAISVPTLSETPMFDETLLTTMFHTARLHGDISQNTLQSLLRSYKHLTGKTVTQQLMASKYAQNTDADGLLSIMAPFSRIERDTMMKACIDVALAEGEVTAAAHEFLLALNTALGLNGTLLRTQIRPTLRPKTAPRRARLTASI
jgi:hypothetical protein